MIGMKNFFAGMNGSPPKGSSVDKRWNIIVTNIMALISAALGGSIGFMLLFYWLENAAIGIFNAIKMIACGRNHIAKLFFAPFFMVHYGGFMLGHLFFLVFLVSMMGEKNVFTFSGIAMMIIGFIGLMITHGIRFIKEETAGEFKNQGPESFMFEPYPRIIVMHITIILGSVIYSLLGKPFLIVIVIIVVKTIVELKSKNIWNIFKKKDTHD